MGDNRSFAAQAVENVGGDARGRALEDARGAALLGSETSPLPRKRVGCHDGDEGAGCEMFSCNICMEMASHPVVTLCGHLYCWPCLYRWLQLQKSVRTCPVCKAGVDRDKVIPVYGRDGNGDPRSKDGVVDVGETPKRPPAQRPVPVVLGGELGLRNHVAYMPNTSWFGDGRGRGVITPEQQHQAFLSRLLLMLGSFVIMCLLLF